MDVTIDGRLVGQAATTGGNVLHVDMTSGQTQVERGAPGTLRFDGLPDRDKDVEVWLPFHERTEIVALRTDAPITPALGDRPVWLHHGSSISQGSNASSPSTTWPAAAAALGGVEVVNLGLAGSAMLDPFTARAMRDTQADVISVKIGINLVNADVMRVRAFGPAVHGFLDTIRDGHPEAPLLVVGPLFCPIHEIAPGPSTFDPAALSEGVVRFIATGDPAAANRGSLTLTVIREQLAIVMAARTAEDPHLHYLDGHDLYGPSDAVDHPLPDNLHPDAATHLLIAERFARSAFSSDGPFALGSKR